MTPPPSLTPREQIPHGEALARQIEAECYDLASLEAEQLLPPPEPYVEPPPLLRAWRGGVSKKSAMEDLGKLLYRVPGAT